MCTSYPSHTTLVEYVVELWLNDLRKMEKAYIKTHSTATYENNNNFICINHNTIRFFRHLALRTSGKFKIIGGIKCIEHFLKWKAKSSSSWKAQTLRTFQPSKNVFLFFLSHFFFLKYCLENFFQNLSNKKRKNNELVTDTKRKTARGGYPLPGNKTRVKVVIYKRKSDK